MSEWKFAGTFQYTGCSCHDMPQPQIRIYYRVFEDWLVIFDVWHKMVQAIYVVNLKSGQVAERIPDSQEQIEKFAAGQFDESDVKPFYCLGNLKSLLSMLKGEKPYSILEVTEHYEPLITMLSLLLV